MITRKWAVSKVKNITVPYNVDTTNGSYKVLTFKPMKKFKTQSEARAYRATYTGKDRVQVINTERCAVSR